MAVLSWGKPLIEFCKSVLGTPDGNWSAFPTPKEDTTKLTPTKGNKKEATQEGGDLVDTRTSKSKFALECEVFVKKGEDRPIEDEDGLVLGNYAVRLTPEDEETEGFIIENCSVSVDESWTSADGKMLKYTFEALKPATGKTLKPYLANSLAVSPETLYFGSAADNVGKAVTAASTGNVTAATCSESWCTVTKTAKVATVKVTENTTGEARSAVVTINADGKTSRVLVTQIPA